MYTSRLGDFYKAVVHACGKAPSTGGDSDARQVLSGTSVRKFMSLWDLLERENVCVHT